MNNNSGNINYEKNAVSALLKAMHITMPEIPDSVTGINDLLDVVSAKTGIMYREVSLPDKWYKDASGPLIATLKDSNKPVALIPSAFGGYHYSYPDTGRKTRINASSATKISDKAICFYRPLPQRQMDTKDLIRYMFRCLKAWDIISFALAAAVITIIGLLTPTLNQILLGPVIQSRSMALLSAAVTFLFFATLSTILLTITRNLLLTRIRNKLSINTGAAFMMRLLSLPAPFFRKHTAGELNQNITNIDTLCNTIVDTFFSSALIGIFSLVYLFQIFEFAPSLVWPSLTVTILTVCITLITSKMQIKVDSKKLKANAKERGFVYSLISGIQKIRCFGVEKQAFDKWSEYYSKTSELTYNPPLFIRLSSVLITAVSLLGTIAMYFIAVKNNVTVADYFAFNASYGYISSAFTAISTLAISTAAIKPILKLLKPIFEAVPESDNNAEIVRELHGDIELQDVSFDYGKNTKPVFTGLNLKINKGDYVAVVGRTGCGKTTLVRLLLGLEKPTSGKILFDNKDIDTINKNSLRQHIGTVMQDGKLFAGTIYDNIVISNPGLKSEDVWKAAEIACIADDIKAMPMGMRTKLQDGGLSLSGGQRQRLLIARAIASKPDILIFDEATSSLDNITQEKIKESLDSLHCTRIVVAHRLSTIQKCNRILVLENGKIAEEGTYSNLIEKNGIFKGLVEGQQM